MCGKGICAHLPQVFASASLSGALPGGGMGEVRMAPAGAALEKDKSGLEMRFAAASAREKIG